MTEPVIDAAQDFLQAERIPGWLVYDCRESNPIFRQLVAPSGHVTRPCSLLNLPQGEPQLLVRRVDAGKFADCGPQMQMCRDRDSIVEGLSRVLSGLPSVAMEYSPMGRTLRVSRVDAGTVELMRSLGVDKGIRLKICDWVLPAGRDGTGRIEQSRCCPPVGLPLELLRLSTQLETTELGLSQE